MNQFVNDLMNPTTIVLALFAALMAIIAWMGRREVRRIDVLEAKAVKTDAFEQMREERRQNHQDNVNTLATINTKLDGITEKVTVPLALLTQRVDGIQQDVKGLRDFKHTVCEPAARYVDYLKTEKPWDRE